MNSSIKSSLYLLIYGREIKTKFNFNKDDTLDFI